MKSILFFLFVGYSFYFVYFGNQPPAEYIFLLLILMDHIFKPWKTYKEIWSPYLTRFLLTLSVALILAGHIKYFLVQPYTVKSESMMPFLKPGEIILVEKVSMGLIMNYYERNTGIKRLYTPWQRKPRIGDVIIFRQPDRQDYLIKRLHSIENHKYCMYGDNLEHSLDSRVFGCIDKERIVGRYVLKLKKLS